jgi:uncharacterized membrane protein
MNRSRKRAITVTLVVLGIAVVALGGLLAAAFPWSQQAGFPFTHMWSQGQGAAPGFMHGPRFFGGGLLVLVVVVLLVSLAVGRGRYWGHDGRERGLDAEEILRRTFAEGRITEEEYKSRLGALRK